MASIEKTWDQERLRRDRLQRVQEEMRRQGLGAMWVSGGVEPFYILGTKVPSCPMFIPQSGEVIAFIRPRDEGYVRRHHANIRPPLIPAVRSNAATKGELARKTAQGIVDLMNEHGVGSEKLGVTSRTEAIKMVEVRPRATGFLDQVNFKDGDDVGKTDILFLIDPRPYKSSWNRAVYEIGRAHV